VRSCRFVEGIHCALGLLEICNLYKWKETVIRSLRDVHRYKESIFSGEVERRSPFSIALSLICDVRTQQKHRAP
jgi:hypothetical protein